MPPVLTEKGITWGYTDREDGWGAATNNSLRLLSEYAFDAFAYNPIASTGLQYAFNAGVIASGGSVLRIPAGVVTLTPSSTNFVERTAAGVVSANTTGFAADRVPLAVVVTTVSAISSVTDRRVAAPIQADGRVVGHARTNGSNTFANEQTFAGTVVIGADPGGAERLRVNESMRLASTSAIPQFYIDCPNVSGFEGRIRFERAGVPRYQLLYRRDGDLIVWGDNTGATIATLNQAGNWSVAGTLAAGGTISTPGNVTIGGVFNGSGAGLSSVPWAGIAGVPSNVANAITQAQGDARYRQTSDLAAAWAQITGIPSNVSGAITQSDGDERYRRLSVNVPWADVTKPAPPAAWTPGTASAVRVGGLSVISGPPIFADPVAEAYARDLQSAINVTSGILRALVDDLRTAGFLG